MAYLINDDIIWLSIPKCASYSIEKALLKSNLKLKKYNEPFNDERHVHIPLNYCLDYFGIKETVCVTRNWFDKWLSAINFIWDIIEHDTPFELICKWEDVTNEIIYDILDKDFIDTLHLETLEDNQKCFLKFLKNKNENLYVVPNIESIMTIVCSLISEKSWKSNLKCTHEFDIKELDKFVDFIENRCGEKLLIEKINKSTKRQNKMIIDDKLKQFVWDNFEKRFEKRNQLI